MRFIAAWRMRSRVLALSSIPTGYRVLTERSMKDSLPFPNVAVLGAGAWGTALAQVAAAAGRAVTLWALEPEVVEAVNAGKGNPLYLPGIELNAAVRATGAMAEAAKADLILAVPPAQHMRAVLKAL